MNWYLLALAASILLTGAYVLEKRSLSRLHSLEFSTELSLFGLIFSIFLIPWVDWSLSFRTYGLIVIQGVVGLYAFLFFLKALKHGEISQTVPLTSLDAIATLIFALLLLSDIPGPLQLIGVGFVAVGSYAIQERNKTNTVPVDRGKRLSLIYLLASMILYGLNKVLVKLVVGEANVVTALFFTYVVYFLGYLALDMIYHHENIVRLKTVIRQWDGNLFGASILLFGYRLAITASFALGSVALATAVSKTSTLFTALAGGALFRESNLSRRLAAAAVMVAGVLLIVLS